VIKDPLDAHNNVARTSYNVRLVQRALSEV
jgi:hypothetical protein